MSTADNLRDRAERLRQQLPPRRTVTPPTENGRRLACISRTETEQIRVNWSEYEGKPYVSLCVWRRGDDGQFWPDPKRGISIRIRELPDLASAVVQAIDLAEEEQIRQRAMRDGLTARPAPRMPGRRWDQDSLPPAAERCAEALDETEEGRR